MMYYPPRGNQPKPRDHFKVKIYSGMFSNCQRHAPEVFSWDPTVTRCARRCPPVCKMQCACNVVWVVKDRVFLHASA